MQADHALLRTGKLYVFDTAVEALYDAGIMHFTMQENIAGLREAIPAMPTMEPGLFWTITVSEEDREIAQQLIDELPFDTTTEPGVWDCDPKPLGKWVWVAVMTLPVTSMLVIQLIGAIRAS